MKYIFRCDANSETGLGHFFRCLSLARWIIALKKEKIEVTFYGNYSDFALSVLKEYNINYIFSQLHLQLNENIDFNIFIGYSYVVLDSYFINQNYINKFSEYRDIKSIVIDDHNSLDYHSIDLVVNYTLGSSDIKYNSLYQAVGIEYFFAKPELLDIREKNLSFNEEFKTVLFFLSGMQDNIDLVNQMVPMIDSNLENKNIILLLKSNRAFKFESLHGNTINVHPFDSKIEKYLKVADLIFSGGGLTKYEAAYCCIPSVVISLNNDQYEEALLFEKEGLSYNIGLWDINKIDNYEQKLNNFFQDKSIAERIFNNQKNMFLGKGFMKIIELINKI